MVDLVEFDGNFHETASKVFIIKHITNIVNIEQMVKESPKHLRPM